MSLRQVVLLNAFGRPRGILGRLGGWIMARANAEFGIRVAGLLDAGPGDHVLEVGFGPGVVVQHLALLAKAERIAGVDVSQEMVEQARARNAPAIGTGRVDLRLGSADRLPFEDESFDKALSINSMQVWPDPAAGLREIRRVLKRGGRLALGFTPRSGQGREGLAEMLSAAGFEDVKLLDVGEGFCVIAAKG